MKNTQNLLVLFVTYVDASNRLTSGAKFMLLYIYEISYHIKILLITLDRVQHSMQENSQRTSKYLIWLILRHLKLRCVTYRPNWGWATGIKTALLSLGSDTKGLHVVASTDKVINKAGKRLSQDDGGSYNINCYTVS